LSCTFYAGNPFADFADGAHAETKRQDAEEASGKFVQNRARSTPFGILVRHFLHKRGGVATADKLLRDVSPHFEKLMGHPATLGAMRKKLTEMGAEVHGSTWTFKDKQPPLGTDLDALVAKAKPRTFGFASAFTDVAYLSMQLVR
jgi:hypothetical protein